MKAITNSLGCARVVFEKMKGVYGTWFPGGDEAELVTNCCTKCIAFSKFVLPAAFGP